MTLARARGSLLCCLGLAASAGIARSEPVRRPLPPPKVFCYVETIYGGASPAELDLGACTDVIEAFLLPDASGSLRAANGLPRHALAHAARRSGCGLLVAIGGSTVPGATFSAIAADPSALRRFTEAVARSVVDGGYDGVDLDWEFPGPSERAIHIGLVRAVRARLQARFAEEPRARRPVILVGVTAGAHLEGYDFPALAREVDYVIQFGYDFRNPALGPWAHTAKLWPDGSKAPVEASVRGVASQIVRRGIPREKLVIGLPFYASDGRPWLEVRERALAERAPPDPLYLETLVDGAWITGPAALQAKVLRILAGTDIAGGGAAGVALWQLGHQGPFRDLTLALRRALKSPGRANSAAQ